MDSAAAFGVVLCMNCVKAARARRNTAGRGLTMPHFTSTSNRHHRLPLMFMANKV